MIIALLLVIILAIMNYQSGTFLSGWDTIHSEFNVWLDLQRTIFGVWQEYRGLGVLDGMGHTADLVRQLILLPISLLLPTSSIRFISQFLWIGIGAIGMGWWFERDIVKDAPKLRRYTVSSIAATAYLLNFGTVSNFQLPLEAFSIFYAFLPWCMWAFFAVLKKPAKKQWLIFILTNILLTPAFYIPTIFIVYGLLLAGISGSYVLFNRSFQTLKKVALAAAFIAMVNAFWLLPFSYFVLTSSHFPREAHINQMSTQEVFIQNKYRGTWQDLVLLRGYYYDAQESENNIMQPWIDHYENSNVTLIAYVFAALVVFGLVTGGKKSYYLAPTFLFTVVTLLGNEPLAEPFHTFIANTSPFLAQVFRSPYTKFISPLILFYAFYIGLASNTIISFFEKRKLQYLSLVIFGCILGASAWLIKPAFEGHLFAESVITEIPDEYFELFAYFENQPADTRIAVLPQYSYWGWTQYEWGYDGSGFIWWGLPQATMDRAFDVWNGSNENYYWELNRAVSARDQEQFDALMQKYRIQWIVVDENLINVESKQNTVGFEAVELLLESDIYQKQTNFGNIAVYKNITISDGYVRSPQTITPVGSTQKWNDWDQLYQNHGEYVYIQEQSKSGGSELQWKFSYPFASLFTNRSTDTDLINVDVLNGGYVLSTQLAESVVGSQLILDEARHESEFVDGDQYMRLNVSLNDTHLADVSAINVNAHAITIDQTGTLAVTIPKLATSDRDKTINKQLFYETQKNECAIKDGGKAKKIITADSEDSKTLTLSTVNNFDCKGITVDDIETTQGYLVTTTTKNIKGFPLLFNWIDLWSGQVISTTKLNTQADIDTDAFILPPMGETQKLYQLSFTNHAYKEFETINEITDISMQKIPYQYIKDIRLEHNTPTDISEIDIRNSQRIFPWLYSVSYAKSSTDSSEYGLLALDQTFDSGWTIIPAVSNNAPLQVVQHTILNNWANSWILKLNQDVEYTAYIVYVPQLLSFVGYIVLPTTAVFSLILGRLYEKIK